MMMQGGNNPTSSSPALVGMIGQNLPHLGASGSFHSGSSHHSITGGRQREQGRSHHHQTIPQLSSTPVHLMGSSSQLNTTSSTGIPDPSVLNLLNNEGKETQSSFGSQHHDFLPFTGLHQPIPNADLPFHHQQQFQPQQQQFQPQYQQHQHQYQTHFQPQPSPYAAPPSLHAYPGGGFMPPGGMYQQHHHLQQFIPPQVMHQQQMTPPWQVASNKVAPVAPGGGGGGGRNQGKIWQEQLAEAVRDKGIMCKEFYTTSRCSLQCCPYAHIKEGQTSVIPDMACNFHLQGRCLRDNCRYFHGSKEQLRTLHRRRAAGGGGSATPPPNTTGGGVAKGGGAVSTYIPSEFLPIRASPVELGLDIIERVIASQGSLPPVAQVAASLLVEQAQVRAAATAGRPQDYFDVPSTNRLHQPAAPIVNHQQQFNYMPPVSGAPEISVYSAGTGGTYQLAHHPAQSHPPPSQQTPNTFNPHPQYYYAVVDSNSNTVQPSQQQWAPQQQQTHPTPNMMFIPAPLISNSHNGNSAIFSNPSTTIAASIHSPSQLAASNNQLAASSHTASASSSQNRPSHSLPTHQVASQNMSSMKGPSSQVMGAPDSVFCFGSLLVNGSGVGGGSSGVSNKDSTTMIRSTSDAFDDCNPTPPQSQRPRAANHLMGSCSSSVQAVTGSDSAVHVGGGRLAQFPNQIRNVNTSDMVFSSPLEGGTPRQFLAPGSPMQTACSTSVSSQQQHARNTINTTPPLKE